MTLQVHLSVSLGAAACSTLLALATGHALAADALCQSLSAVIAHTPDGFAMLEGDLSHNSPDGNPTQRRATVAMPGSIGCVINFGKQYYCDYPNGTDFDALTAHVARCLKSAQRVDPQVFKTPNGAKVSVVDDYDEVALVIEMS